MSNDNVLKCPNCGALLTVKRPYNSETDDEYADDYITLECDVCGFSDTEDVS